MHCPWLATPPLGASSLSEAETSPPHAGLGPDWPAGALCLATPPLRTPVAAGERGFGPLHKTSRDSTEAAAGSAVASVSAGVDLHPVPGRFFNVAAAPPALRTGSFQFPRHPATGPLSAAVLLRPPAATNAHVVPVQHEASPHKGPFHRPGTRPLVAAGALVRAADGAPAGPGALSGRRTAPQPQYDIRRPSMADDNNVVVANVVFDDVCRLLGGSSGEHDPRAPSAARARSSEEPGENCDRILLQHLVQTLPLGELVLVPPAGVHELERALPQTQPEFPGPIRALRHHVLPGDGVPGLPRPLEVCHGTPWL